MLPLRTQASAVLMCPRCVRRLRWPWWRLLLWSGVLGRSVLACPHTGPEGGEEQDEWEDALDDGRVW